MKAAGIYQIECKTTGHRYVGSAVNLHRRRVRHFYELGRGNHHCQPLQRAFHRYGADSFVFSPLLICSSENLAFYEKRAIAAFGYFNVQTEPGRTNLGVKHAPETRMKIAAALGRGPANHMYGRKLSPEWIANSLAGKAGKTRKHKGRKQEEWHVQKRVTAFKARGVKRSHSLETRERMSEKTRGSKHPMAKLEESHVQEILAALSRGELQRVIADRHGVSIYTINKIKVGKTWKSVQREGT